MNKRALLSVTDKTGIVEFAKGLEQLGYEIISTGGTQTALEKGGVRVKNISEITGFPECLDGRVKTLHPVVHAGLLAMRDNPNHMRQLSSLHIAEIDVIAVNLYPFAATVARPEVTRDEAVENIDIGGPTMLRSAAKNYKHVISAVDPADYSEILSRLKSNTADEEFRLNLMLKVFSHTAHYDSMISAYLCAQAGVELPEYLTLGYKKAQGLRYGENPHQKAAFYAAASADGGCLSNAIQLQGKELSYNNINDAFGAIELLREFDSPAAVAIKHANPCGVAIGSDVFEAYSKAHGCDPVSIYGGIVAVNRPLDEVTAAEMIKTFLEIVIAPAVNEKARQIFAQKPNLRVLELADLDKPNNNGFTFKYVEGGLLYQSRDLDLVDSLKNVTSRAATEQEREQLLFAYKVVRHVKSNAIVLCKDFAAVGIGAGQTSRVWATEQAIAHAGERARGAVAASDAFFPFDDCAGLLADAGISAIIQPGGSVRDGDTIKLCDARSIAMIFAGNRHFKH